MGKNIRRQNTSAINNLTIGHLQATQTPDEGHAIGQNIDLNLK